MASKLEVKGNYLIITDTVTSQTTEYPTSRVRYKDTPNIITFDYIDNDSQSVEVVKTDILDSSGSAFASDEDLLLWLRWNTGFNSTLGGSRVVRSKYDFPASIAGVITLEANKTYIVQNEVDLLGDRLEAGGVVNLFGTSSETSSLTSTGLGVGVPLLTSIYTIVLEKITFKDVDTCIDIDGNTNLVALDWENVNFSNIPNVGTINTCDNFIFETGAFLSAQGLVFTGTIGTIGVFNTLFVGIGSAGNIIELDASCIITRRFRIIYSSFIAFGSTVGINVNASATISAERYILDTINFSGGGTYLSGVSQTSNKALFNDCVGVSNTAVNGQIYMQSNATATTIASSSTFYKVAGTTTASADNQKYTSTDNRLTNDAVVTRKYLIQCTLSFNSSNGNICEFGFYDSVLSAVRTPSRTKSTANAAGRAENIHFQCLVSHIQGDYLEIHCSNTTGANDITVTEMNFVITEIK